MKFVVESRQQQNVRSDKYTLKPLRIKHNERETFETDDENVRQYILQAGE